jgi:hypothetical protein
MKLFPSTSYRRAPLARLMKSGCPPTDRKARTGLLTPPGITRCAAANSFLDVVVFIKSAPPYHGLRKPVKKSRQRVVRGYSRSTALRLGLDFKDPWPRSTKIMRWMHVQRRSDSHEFPVARPSSWLVKRNPPILSLRLLAFRNGQQHMKRDFRTHVLLRTPHFSTLL